MTTCRLLLGFAAIIAMAPRAGAADFGLTGSPWTTYEAESSATNGTMLGPEYIGHSAAREASGRRCVRLDRTGQFVKFTAKEDAQGLVVRYCIPDSPNGGGTDATLDLYINGQLRKKLAMTSRYSYLYGAYPFSNEPSAGTPRNFWNELRLMPGEIHEGDEIRLQEDKDNAAAWYLIDLIDLERVPAAIRQPADSISVADFGATGNDRSDDRGAFVATIAAAKATHKTVWIPPGRFVIGGPLKISDVAIRGAGMWYSTLVGADDYSPGHRVAIEGDGSNIKLADFSIVGKLDYRNDSEANDGIGGSFGTGSSIRDIWVEHTKTGAWLVNSEGLLIEGCRFRDTIADGINLCVGMKNTIVRDCSARGTGDDCFAIWPASYAEATYPPGHNRFVHCLAQLPFLAQGFAIYGGDSNTVENCRAIDIPYGAGLFASTTFPTRAGFQGITTFRETEISRAGDNNGAIGIVTDLTDLSGLRFSDIAVTNSATDGIRFISLKGHALSDTAFKRVEIVNSGLSGAGYGVVAAADAVGSATLNDVNVRNARNGGFKNLSARFTMIREPGNSGTKPDVTTGEEDSAGQRSGGLFFPDGCKFNFDDQSPVGKSFLCGDSHA